MILYCRVAKESAAMAAGSDKERKNPANRIEAGILQQPQDANKGLVGHNAKWSNDRFMACCNCTNRRARGCMLRNREVADEFVALESDTHCLPEGPGCSIEGGANCHTRYAPRTKERLGQSGLKGFVP